MVEENWWDERLEAWSHEGFDTEDIRKSLEENHENASELMIEYENLVKINRALRRRIIDSSLSHEKKGDWLEKLDEFSNTENTLLEWESDSRQNRPWEPYVNRSEKKWIDLGIRNELTKIVKRLEALDISSYPACQPIYILFDDVGSIDSIKSMLTEIEEDEQNRRNIIAEMISILQEEGVDASAARMMPISDALDYINSMQGVAKQMRETRLRIDKEIRPFDEELADKLMTKRNEGLDDEVSSIVENLGARLTGLNSKIKQWENEGIHISDKSKISADELLEWEANLPDLEKMVDAHANAVERWNQFRKVWPEKVQNLEFIGQLEKTDELLDVVDSLEQEWRTYELEGMDLISKWENFGFVMDLWRSRISEEPRSALAWLKIEDENYSMARDLIQALMRLDASISGEDEIMKRAAILREFELDTNILEEMSDFIEIQARRAARHRGMLEIEWIEMVRLGTVEDRSTANLTLAEFEKLIADSRMGRSGFSVPVDRLGENLRNEIERWHQLGFDVNNLREDLTKNPMELALKISSIREMIQNHAQLIRRLENLDWTRSPELSVAVNLELSQPDRLSSLASSIPEIAIELSKKEVQDEHFRFIPWRPNRRSRKVLVPVPKNTADDAMEAILEEMDNRPSKPIPSKEIKPLTPQEPLETMEIAVKEEENPRPLLTEVLSRQEEVEEEIVEEEIVEEEIVEEEPPKKKPSRIKGLVSGGGRDGVGKFGAVGDVIGGITDRIGVTDYGLAGKSAAKKKEKEEAEQQQVVVGDSSSIESVLRSLGLEKEADMLLDDGDINSVRRALASHVGLEPRDTRLDRLLRLSLRLMPKGDDEDEQRYALLSSLSELAKELSKWTRIRLEARHSGSTGYLLEDAKTLGVALKRIPGPGTPLPLLADEHELPSNSDLEGLSNEIRILSKRVILATSGGVR